METEGIWAEGQIVEIVKVSNSDFTEEESKDLRWAMNNTNEPKMLEVNSRHINSFPAGTCIFFRFMDGEIDHYHIVPKVSWGDIRGFLKRDECGCHLLRYKALANAFGVSTTDIEAI